MEGLNRGGEWAGREGAFKKVMRRGRRQGRGMHWPDSKTKDPDEDRKERAIGG